jgi:hypothetical protein
MNANIAALATITKMSTTNFCFGRGRGMNNVGGDEGQGARFRDLRTETSLTNHAIATIETQGARRNLAYSSHKTPPPRTISPMIPTSQYEKK